MDGFIWAVGGANNNMTVERYDPEENKWTEVSQLNGAKGLIKLGKLKCSLPIVEKLNI